MLAFAVIFNLATPNCFQHVSTTLNTMSSPLRNSTSIVSDFNHDQLSLEIEDTNYKKPVEHKESWKTVLLLAYQSLGVVYGDLSVAPLYVYQSTFAEDIEHSESNDEIFGVLSFVFWTLTLIPLLKYVFIVFRADDNGEGGTFALYSLLCRYAKVGFLPNSQVVDRDLSAYKNDHVDATGKNKGFWLKSVLEKCKVLQIMLLVLTLFGACMVIGDGILTPSILVTSSVTGFNVRHTSRVEDLEVAVACSILVCVFVLQRYGTHRVGSLFAPIIMIWLLSIGGIGLYNICSWNHQVYRALNPRYMHKFLKKTGHRGWLSLGGILLCVTGSEAMFSNLGHFSQLSIKIAFTLMVYPCSILSYMGQGAYLSKSHSNEQKISLYMSVPPQVKTPFLVISILAAAVGSQTIITGTFSIIKQCSALGCFPRVKVIHTSSKVRGQVYIPEVNWILMLLCLAVIIGFRDTTSLSNASGLAVITVMLVTTCLMFLVIVICWNQSIFVALGFFLFFGSIEGVYISASVSKFSKGAWAPIAISSVVMTVMCVWHYGTIKKYEFDVQNKVSLNWLLSLGPSLGIVRVPGIGIVHTDLVSGIPAMFSHFVMNLPAFHQVLVFLCVKSVPVPHVQPGERFLIGRLGPKDCRFYRCIVRYGYREVQTDGVEFEQDIILSIAEFIRSDPLETKGNIEETMTVVRTPSNHILVEHKHPSVQGELNSSVVERKRVKFMLPENSQMSKSVRDELQVLMDARESGMAFIVGRSCVRAQHQANPIKKMVIDVGYDFLRRNSRDPAYEWSIPHISTLEVGMVYLV